MKAPARTGIFYLGFGCSSAEGMHSESVIIKATSSRAQRNTKARNRARQSHAGIGMWSLSPLQTPPILSSLEDFLRLRKLFQNML